LLAGKVSENMAFDSIFIRTRRFARKQMTWIRSLKELNIINITDKSEKEVVSSVIGFWGL
jgi:tRNA A37 N6-isopentenylltransferase MiaA